MKGTVTGIQTMNPPLAISRLLDYPQALPTLPRSLHNWVQAVDLSEAPLKDITRQVEGDPVLTAQLLRMVNSAYFGLERRISSLADALAMLGSATVSMLIIGTALKQCFVVMPGTDLRPFWRYSLHAAALARWLAQAKMVEPGVAFSAGLMHALGYLVMLVAQPLEIRALDRDTPLTHEGRQARERERWGYCFSDITLALAERWAFPDRLLRTLSQIGDQSVACLADPLSCVVNLAVWRARCDSAQLEAPQIEATFPAAWAQQLGLTREQVTEQWPSREQALGPFAMLLHGCPPQECNLFESPAYLRGRPSAPTDSGSGPAGTGYFRHSSRGGRA